MVRIWTLLLNFKIHFYVSRTHGQYLSPPYVLVGYRSPGGACGFCNLHDLGKQVPEKHTAQKVVSVVVIAKLPCKRGRD